jgi:hypothetical protein
MEDKRGTKCSHSPSKEGSSSPSSVSMLPPSPSRSPPPPGSLPEVSSHWLRSLVFEQGGPSERVLVVDLSSDVEDFFPDTLRDDEFTRKLFGDLNHKLLGSLGDGNVIVLSDSDEEEEVYEEDTVDTEATPPSIEDSLVPTISTANANDASEGAQNDSNDSRTSNRA